MNFQIIVNISTDKFKFENFIWNTRCNNWEQAMDRAKNFAVMALKEVDGESIDTIKVERNALEL